jgi:hypothetical protein
MWTPNSEYAADVHDPPVSARTNLKTAGFGKPLGFESSPFAKSRSQAVEEANLSAFV